MSQTEVAHTSSLISRAHYERKQRVLTVTLRTGEVCEFVGVPLDIFNNFATSPSLGKAFSALIQNKYPSRKL